MRNIRKWVVYVLTVAVFVGIMGCESSNPVEITADPEGAAEKRTIGISFPTIELAYREKMLEIVQTAYTDEDMDVQILIRDAGGSQKKQNQDILDLVEAGVDGIVLIPYTTEGPISAVQYANERQIPVITVDNTLEEDSGAEVISYVGADHYSMGKQAAELLLNVLENRIPEKEQWNIIELAGSPGASGTIDREEGIHSVLDGNAKVRVLATYNAEFTIANGKSVMDDCLQVYKGIDGVICQNDLMALGCYESLKEAGMLGEIIVIGIDGQKDVVEKMVSGGIDGTVIQYPQMILTGIEKLLAYLDGEEILPIYYQDTDMITTEEAQKYLDETKPW